MVTQRLARMPKAQIFRALAGSFPVEPHSGEPLDAAGLDVVSFQGADHGLFQGAQKAVDVGEVVVQIEDGIAHDLPGPW
jgi:hypothetical protein